MEGAQGGRGHGVARALGRGPPGLAHRVLGDGRAAARAPTSRSTAAARTWCSPTTRTRSPRPRPRAASRSPGSGCTTAWCRWATEKMAKSVGNIRLLHEALDEYGRDALIMYFVGGHYRQPIAFSAEALEEAGRSVERVRELCRRLDRTRPRPGGPRRLRRALLRRAGRRLQHPGGARACCSSGWPRPTAASTPASALGVGPAGGDAARARPGEPARGRRRTRPTPRPSACSSEREAARAARDFERADAHARRAGRARLGGARHRRRAPRLVRAERVIVYGRNPVREALRGRRTVQRVWATEAPRRGLAAGREADVTARARAALRLRRTTRASAPRWRPTPTPTPDALLAAEDALVVCLDEVQDPHNLGAVCRVAEAAGAAGRGDPRAPRRPR